jgi:hypothetical protein
MKQIHDDGFFFHTIVNIVLCKHPLLMKIQFYPQVTIVILIILTGTMTGCMEQSAAPISEEKMFEEMGDERDFPISYDEGLIKAKEFLVSEEGGDLSEISIHLIQAKGVDSEGKALQWIFGLSQDNLNYFVLVTSNRQVVIPYFMELPQMVITQSALMKPDKLIEKNRELLIKMGSREPLILPELEISKDVYTITLSNGEGRAVKHFNASTGNPLE